MGFRGTREQYIGCLEEANERISELEEVIKIGEEHHGLTVAKHLLEERASKDKAWEQYHEVVGAFEAQKVAMGVLNKHHKKKRDRYLKALEPVNDLFTLVRATLNPPKDLDDMIAFMQKKINTVLKGDTDEQE